MAPTATFTETEGNGTFRHLQELLESLIWGFIEVLAIGAIEGEITRGPEDTEMPLIRVRFRVRVRMGSDAFGRCPQPQP